MFRLSRVLFFFLSFFLSVGVVRAQAVSLNGEGGVQESYGESWIRALPVGEGHGNYAVSEMVGGEWAAFHCESAGSGACATDLAGDAEKIGGGEFSVQVPAQNQRVFVGRHAFDAPTCGRVQYDIGIDGEGTIGGWVHNFGSDCEGGVQQLSCEEYREVNTQFRIAGQQQWRSGSDLGQLPVGQRVDVNCFAKTGTALLPEAEVVIERPDGSETRSTAELRGYRLARAGEYRFTCRSEAFTDVCEDTDRLRVRGVEPTATPMPPIGGREPLQSSCDELRIVSGAGERAPAMVRFETNASDNRRDIRRYRYHFGDGSVETFDSAPVEHRYETGGDYHVFVEVLDSQGNWRTSDVCQTTLSLKTALLTAHRSACTELSITSGNYEQAPSRVEMRVYGYDNKGDLQGYKVDFGDGVTEESDDGRFSHTYSQVGTYEVQGYVKDSTGAWVDGDYLCDQRVKILTEPLKEQPKTGASGVALALTGMSGVSGVGLWLGRKFVF